MTRHMRYAEAVAEARATESSWLPISDRAARALAAGWQGSGPVGSVLAAVASGAEWTPSDLLADIAATRAAYRIEPEDHLALKVLAQWANGVTERLA